MFLSIQNISKSYKSQNGRIQREVFNNFNFSLDKNEKIAVTGPSGSGKTTLLNLIALLDKPDSGAIIYNNSQILSYSDQQVNNYRNSEIGFIFQKHHLLPQCTVLENVLLPTLADKNKNTSLYNRAKDLIKQLNIDDLINRKPGELSVGECQRVAIARALIKQPKLLLADEPTGSLDTDNSHNLLRILLDLNDYDNLTIILVTHTIELAKKMDKVYTLGKESLELL